MRVCRGRKTKNVLEGDRVQTLGQNASSTHFLFYWSFSETQTINQGQEDCMCKNSVDTAHACTNTPLLFVTHLLKSQTISSY